MWCPEMGGLHGMSDTTGNEMKSIPEAISFLLSFFFTPRKEVFFVLRPAGVEMISPRSAVLRSPFELWAVP